MMKKNKTIIIGIAGASASGKSLLTNTIIKELDSKQVAVIQEDAYYKPFADLTFEERTKINFDHPDSLDHALLIEHLEALQRGETIHIPVYDYAQYTRLPDTQAINGTIIILEGILLFTDPVLREKMDIRIFMDAPLDICFTRRLVRDMAERGRTVESVLKRYHETVRPMFLQFIEPSKRYADIIVPRGGENRIAIEMIKAMLGSHLH